MLFALLGPPPVRRGISRLPKCLCWWDMCVDRECLGEIWDSSTLGGCGFSRFSFVMDLVVPGGWLGI